jgi:hypothetical protein
MPPPIAVMVSPTRLADVLASRRSAAERAC